jgi:hypothetical protein
MALVANGRFACATVALDVAWATGRGAISIKGAAIAQFCVGCDMS